MIHTFAADRNATKQLMTLLAENDAIDPNKRNQYKESPLHLAVKNRCVENVKLLAAHPKVDINKPINRTRNYRPGEVSRLLAESEDPVLSRCEFMVDDPADVLGYCTIVLTLLKHGANTKGNAMNLDNGEPRPLHRSTVATRMEEDWFASLQSIMDRTLLLQTLASVRLIPRIGSQSPLKQMPVEMIRELARYLYAPVIDAYVL